MLPHSVTTLTGAVYGCTCSIGADHEQVQSDLVIWTIYQEPADYPTVPYVVRGWLIAGATPIDIGALGFADTIDEARSMLPEGLTLVGRSTDDEPQIVESWL